MPVVVAIDRSDSVENLVAEAAKMSERFDTELHVVHVAGQYETTERVRLEAIDGSADPVEMDDEARPCARRERRGRRHGLVHGGRPRWLSGERDPPLCH